MAKKKMWRCRLCGHEQPVGENNNICENAACGVDLTLYGDVVRKRRAGAHGPSLPWKSVVAAIITVAAVAAAAGVGFGVWRFSRQKGGPPPAPQSPAQPSTQQPSAQQPPAEPDRAEFPDFAAFSDGWAHKLAEGNGEAGTETYEYTGQAGDVMIPEYIDRLTGGGDFKFALTDTTTLTGEAAACTYYTFSYTGSAQVTGITAEDRLEGQEFRAGDDGGAALVLCDRRRTGGGGRLTLTHAPELEAVDGGDKTSYSFEGDFTLQDFDLFSGGLVEDLRETEMSGSMRYQYLLRSDEAVEAARRYIDLISSCAYPFRLNQSGERQEGEYMIEYYGFEELGPSRLEHYSISDSDGNKFTKSLAVYIGLARHSNGRTVWLTMYVPKELSLVDDGYRGGEYTRFDPVFPDFAGFSNGWTHELAEKRQTEGVVYDRYYEYTGEAGDSIVPQYIDLLTRTGYFPYEPAGTKTLSNDAISVTCYCFLYTGDADVAEFSLTSSLGDQTIETGDVDLVIADTRYARGGGELKLTYSSGLSVVPAPIKTGYEYEGEYTLQDFTSFAGGLAGEPTESENKYGRSYIYEYTDSLADVVEQYIELIAARAYPYYLLQDDVHTGDGNTYDFAGFEEFGPDERLAHFYFTDSAGEYYTDGLVVYVGIFNGKSLRVCVSPGITMTDDGYRAEG